MFIYLESVQYFFKLKALLRRNKIAYKKICNAIRNSPNKDETKFHFTIWLQCMLLIDLTLFIFFNRKKSLDDNNYLTWEKNVVDKDFITSEQLFVLLCKIPHRTSKNIIADIDANHTQKSTLLKFIKQKNKERFLEYLEIHQIDTAKACAKVQNLYISQSLSAAKDKDALIEQLHIALDNNDSASGIIKTALKIELAILESDSEDVFLNKTEKLFNDLISQYKIWIFEEIPSWDLEKAEKNAIFSLLEMDKDIYERLQGEYEKSKSIDTLPQPEGISKELMMELYEELHFFISPGQDFLFFFSYGLEEKKHNENYLIWNTSITQLKCFLEYLYNGYIIEDRYTSNQDLIIEGQIKKEIYDCVGRVFRNKNSEEINLTTLINNSSTDKDETIMKIFRNVFTKNKIRKKNK